MFEDKMTKKINENVLLKYGARHFAYTLKNCFARKRTCKIETGKNLGRVYKWCSFFFCVAWEAFKRKNRNILVFYQYWGCVVKKKFLCLNDQAYNSLIHFYIHCS